MATVELAVAIPSLLIVLVMALAAVDLGLSQVRCVDAARLGARLVARAEPESVVLEEALRAAPDGSSVAVSHRGGLATVTVTAPGPAVVMAIGVIGPPRATAVASLEMTR